MTDSPSFTSLDGGSAYDILGVTSDASSEAIKKAFRDRMRVEHPDRGGSERTARLLTTAVAWLTQHRTEYDQYLVDARAGSETSGSGDAWEEAGSAWDSASEGTFGTGRPGSADSFYQPPSGYSHSPTSSPPPPRRQPAAGGSPTYGGQPSYGQQPSYGYPRSRPGAAVPQFGNPRATGTNMKAVAALVLGFLIPPLGLVFGLWALSEIRISGQPGRGLAITGVVFGALSILFFAFSHVG